MDLLSDVLSTVHFKGTLYCQGEFTAPWGLEVGPYPGHNGFIMVVRGGALLEIAGQTPVSMAAGDLMLSRAGTGYAIRDSVNSPLISIDKAVASITHNSKILKFGGGGTPSILIMGCFEFETADNNPLINALPTVIYVPAQDLQSEPWLENTFRFLAAEATCDRPGSTIAVSRLTDLLFIQAIRAHIGQVKNCPESAGWLKAIEDPQIGRALSLIHQTPEAPWTVATLAETVSMSRSSFSARFSKLLNTSPLEYVTAWRMQKAQEMLRQGVDNLSEVASRIGYQSEAAFRKAFKRETGEAPGSFRKKTLSHT